MVISSSDHTDTTSCIKLEYRKPVHPIDVLTLFSDM